MNFYTTQKISGRRSKTPEGFLLIEGVPLARTGMMIYGPHELGLPGGPDGLLYIERTPEEVFRPETVASANGKDIVNDHPEEDVTPLNYGDVSLGVLMNPRRGKGIEDEFLVGDLLVKRQEGIDLIEDGKVELSMGYDAGYVMREPGRGYQKNIIYNHVALVDKGRCGPRCSIGDRQYIQEKDMSGTVQRTADRGRGSSAIRRVLDRLIKVAKVGDEEMLEETLGDAEKELEKTEPRFEIHNHNHMPGDKEMTEEEKEDKKTDDRIRKAVGDALAPVLDAIDKRLRDMAEEFKKKGEDKEDDKDDKETEDNEKILGALELEAPPGTNDRARKSKDSAFLAESFQETVALAEVLAPGIGIPTFDGALDPKKTYDALCGLRRKALDLAFNTPEGRTLVESVGGSQFRTMDCAMLRPVFLAAGNLKKHANNGGSRTTDVRLPGGAAGGTRRTIADVNKRNAEFYSGKK